MEKSCGFYIINKNNELLITHPYLGKGNGSWGIPKGKIDGGETKLQAAFRELQEETGLTIDDCDFVSLYKLPSRRYKSKNKILYSWLMICDNFYSDTKIECISTFEYKGKLFPENDKYMWIDINDKNLKTMLHEAQVENIDIIIETINKNNYVR